IMILCMIKLLCAARVSCRTGAPNLIRNGATRSHTRYLKLSSTWLPALNHRTCEASFIPWWPLNSDEDDLQSMPPDHSDWKDQKKGEAQTKMAFDNTEVVVKCGKTTIRYPRGCAYGCFCNSNHWARPCT